MVLIDKYRYDFWWIDPWENNKSLTQQFQVSPWDYVWSRSVNLASRHWRNCGPERLKYPICFPGRWCRPQKFLVQLWLIEHWPKRRIMNNMYVYIYILYTRVCVYAMRIYAYYKIHPRNKIMITKCTHATKSW